MDEFRQPYAFVAGDVTAADNYTVVAPTGGTAGRWLLRSVFLTLSPLGSGVDDGPRIQAAAAAIAAYVDGGWVQFTSGVFTINTPIDVSQIPGAMFVGTAETVLKSTLTPSGPGGYLQSAIYGNVISAAATTLSGNATIGSNTIAVNANTIPNGSRIYLRREDGTALIFQQFVVLSGGGTATLTLDDVVEYHFLTNDTVFVGVSPIKVRIIGNGMRISGTGDRAIELAFSDGSYVCDVWITREYGSFSIMCGSYDVGGRRNMWQRVRADAGGVTRVGLAMENEVDGTIDNCEVCFTSTAAIDAGYYMPTNAGGLVADSTAFKCGQGLWMTCSNAADVDACRNNTISRCNLSSNVRSGVQIDGGSDNTLSDLTAEYNGVDGLTLNKSLVGSPSVGVQLSNAQLNSNGTSGIRVPTGQGAAELFGVNVTCSKNAGAGAAQALEIQGVGARIEIDGYRSDDNVGGPWIVNNASTLVLKRGRVTNTALATNWYGQIAGVSIVRLEDYACEYVAGAGTKAICIVTSAGDELHLSRVKTIGTMAFGVWSGNAVATKIFRYEGVDLTSCVTPWFFDPAALANFGTLTLNGVNQVNVTGCFLADDTIGLSLKTVGTTPGAAAPYFSAAQTPGNFYVKSPTGACNDVYNWHAY